MRAALARMISRFVRIAATGPSFRGAHQPPTTLSNMRGRHSPVSNAIGILSVWSMPMESRATRAIEAGMGRIRRANANR